MMCNVTSDIKPRPSIRERDHEAILPSHADCRIVRMHFRNSGNAKLKSNQTETRKHRKDECNAEIMNAIRRSLGNAATGLSE